MKGLGNMVSHAFRWHAGHPSLQSIGCPLPLDPNRFSAFLMCPPWLGCCVCLSGLVFLLSPVLLSPSLSIMAGMLCPPPSFFRLRSCLHLFCLRLWSCLSLVSGLVSQPVSPSCLPACLGCCVRLVLHLVWEACLRSCIPGCATGWRLHCFGGRQHGRLGQAWFQNHAWQEDDKAHPSERSSSKRGGQQFGIPCANM